MRTLIKKAFLRGRMNPPPEGSEVFFFTEIVPEHSGISPLNVSTFEGYERGREEFLRGAALLGLGTPEAPKRKSILPQQYVIADALNAQDEHGIPAHNILAVCVPRRAAKTTSFWAVALGRISNPDRDAYQVAFTAQTQAKARLRFLKDVVVPLERAFPDPATAPFHILKGASASSITWKSTGGMISILGPSDEAFRGDAYSLVGVDEAQEIAPGDDSTQLMQGILPTLATTLVTVDGVLHAAGQLVLIGTAGAHKSGLFHDELEKGRAGTQGIVEYGAHPSTPDFDPDEDESTENTTADPEVWAMAHPALGVLIPPSVIEASFSSMTLEAFKREWLGIWPDSSSSSFIRSENWNKCRVTGVQPVPPAHFVIGFAVDHDGRSGCIVAAWRDENGLSHMGILDHRPGTTWMAVEIAKLARKYKVPVVYDSASGEAENVVTAMNRLKPRPILTKMVWHQVSSAHALLVRDINRGAFRHYDQPAMNETAAIVTKRVQPESKRWSFRKPKGQEGKDITPFEAGALALRHYDETPEREVVEMIV
jgi:phage terminase large subunit-like protein